MANVSSDKHEEPRHQNLANKCKEIEEKKFVSIKKFPRFRASTLAPNTVEFKDGKFHYSYGDMEIFGQIICEINDIFVSISTTRGFTGKYNRNSKRLIWEGIEYVESQ